MSTAAEKAQRVRDHLSAKTATASMVALKPTKEFSRVPTTSAKPASEIKTTPAKSATATTSSFASPVTWEHPYGGFFFETVGLHQALSDANQTTDRFAAAATGDSAFEIKRKKQPNSILIQLTERA